MKTHTKILEVLVDQHLTLEEHCKSSKERFQEASARIFSTANLALAGFPLTNALGENLPSRH